MLAQTGNTTHYEEAEFKEGAISFPMVIGVSAREGRGDNFEQRLRDRECGV